MSSSIVVVRDQRVMLDRVLAALYDIETRALVQAVKRNSSRFPVDFCFQLNDVETALFLRSQTVTSKKERRGGRRTNPFAFTEQGVAMLSSVLRSSRAVAVNVEIMRAFVRLREAFTVSKELAQQLAALESRIDKRLLEQDRTIVEILQAIRTLMAGPVRESKPIGFITDTRKPR